MISQSIKNRISTFPISFSGQKIEDAIIKEMLETAVWAPTHKLTEPWRFKVFSDMGIQTFFNKQIDIYKEITPKEKIKSFKINKYHKKAEVVSHVIAVIAEHDVNNSIPEVEEIVAASCVIQNIYLLMQQYGIGGYLSTGELCYTHQMADFIGINKGEKLLGYFQLGIPKETFTPLERSRTSAKQKTVWVVD